jgi:hypothetical protein
MFLRGIVFLLGAIVLGLCVFALPVGITTKGTAVYRPLLFGLYVAAVPFFVALYQALKLLDFVDHNQAFSNLSVSALRTIKYCALIIAGLGTAALPYVLVFKRADISIGIIMMNLVVVFASTVFGVFAAVLQKLMQDGLEIKSENDLTV